MKRLVMKMSANYSCIHEEMLQKHNVKITALEKELSYKKERLDELKEDNKRMENKIDDIKESVNKIIMASKSDDDKLDKRLTKIETRLQTQEEISRDNKDDFNLKLGVVTVIFIVLTFYFNFIHHL